ncbi:MAG: ribonuclease P protein component [Clostridia bacterium]|nr:ribonuclease P protein component [Clostridia bacterium]
MQSQHRLKKRAAFAYVYRKGEKVSAANLMLISAKSREGLKIGLSVSKKVGNSVTRNHVKRLLREAIALIEEKISSDFMYVIVAYPGLADAGYEEVCSEIRKVFSDSGKIISD